MKEIRNIIAKYRQADRQKERLALATVVKIEQSSYRRIGARMLVSSNGTWIGGISGGCLEGDALRRSQKAIFNELASVVVYDTLDDEDRNIGIGLGCNGRIEVLFVPITYDDLNNPVELLINHANQSEASIMVNLISCSRLPLKIGECALINQSVASEVDLSIPQPFLEAKIAEVRIKRRPQIIDYEHEEFGSMQYLVEYLRPEYKLIIIGDNYDVLAMTGLAKEMGWEISIVGRKSKMSKSLVKQATAVYEYEQISQISIDEFTAVLLMTHDFEWDQKLIPHLLETDAHYIGMLGPRKRMLKMSHVLGISLDKIDHFYSPMGLDIGAETPEEIALSAMAEIICLFRSRNGSHLKFRQGTIHNA